MEEEEISIKEICMLIGIVFGYEDHGLVMLDEMDDHHKGTEVGWK